MILKSRKVNRPVKNYFMKQKSGPMKKDEVQQNSDPHIDQDFPGYPHLPADKESITPVTVTEKKLAGDNKKKSKKVYGS